jgi:recombination protein RecR
MGNGESITMRQRSSDEQAHPYGSAVAQLIEQFATLPGIGRKSAERLAHHILASPREEALRLAEAIQQVKEAVHPCAQCFNLTEEELCAICRDSKRQRHILCIVEQPRDVVALEAAGVFNGLYHVLQGRISPLEGVGPEDLTIGPLIQRVRNTGVTEIVMATNPTVEGDGTALYISNLLAGEAVKITRLARGIPTGSVLEFANREMLADALMGRQEF